MKGFIEVTLPSNLGDEVTISIAVSAITSITKVSNRAVITLIEKQKDGTNTDAHVNQSYEEVLTLIGEAS